MLGLHSWDRLTLRSSRPARSVFALITLCSTALPGLAAPTRVTLLNAAPELTGLVACLAAHLGNLDSRVGTETLSEGLEFRMTLSTEPDKPALLIIQSLLKPDVASLVESHNHDDDPEAQPEAARRFFQLLRIPVGTRAWVWKPKRESAICGEAANWMTGLRSHPILFDRLGPGGDPF